MTTCYLKKGRTFVVSSKEDLDLHEQLPAGNYVLKLSMTGFYLEAVEGFEIPKKLYGSLPQQTDRILHTFLDRDNSTGILLSGEKGSGKTLLAKNICRTALQSGVPTIIINSPFHGDGFSSLIQQINQPCIIMFDEFEKVYADETHQQAILTLLDGVFPSKKLFILTSNDKYKINYHMRNRPGRVYYMLDFRGIGTDFVRGYCEDNLKNKANIDKVCKIATVFDVFNFDMLKALVEEMNRFDESPQDAIVMLNTKPEFSNKMEYEVEIIVDGKEIKPEYVITKKIQASPLLAAVNMAYYEVTPTEQKVPVKGSGKGKKAKFTTRTVNVPSAQKNVTVTHNDIVDINEEEEQFLFKKGNVEIVLTKVRYEPVNYYTSLDF